MNAKDKTSSKPIPSVRYIRMSSDPQETSPEQQRTELKLLEKHFNYECRREYVDEGKSGSKATGKRTDFLRMIEDSNQRQFAVVTCWDLARFGRLDSLKAAKYKDTLRENGVFLHTVKEGQIRWDT